MSNYQQRRIDDIIEWRLQRAQARANRYRPEVNLASVPPAAVVQRRTSGQAVFHYCRNRRRGYVLDVDPKQLSGLNSRPTSPEALARLEDHWLRGLMWNPVSIIVEWVNGRWVLRSNHDYPIVVFLADKGVKTIRVQAFEPGDPPACRERAEAFTTEGIYSSTANKPCTIIQAQVTL